AKFAVAHGEAVGIGMVVEARLGELLGITERGTATRIRTAVDLYGLPTAPPPDASADALLAAMQDDKKARSSAIRCVLPSRIGAAHGNAKTGWTVQVSEEAVREAIGGS